MSQHKVRLPQPTGECVVVHNGVEVVPGETVGVLERVGIPVFQRNHGLHVALWGGG